MSRNGALADLVIDGIRPQGDSLPLMHRISAGYLTQAGKVETVVLLNVSTTEGRSGDCEL